MAGSTLVTIVGSSVHEIADVWGQLQPFYRSADLIVTPDPAGRALEGPVAAGGAVFAVLGDAAGIERLRLLNIVPDWLFVLCPDDLAQTCLADLRQANLPVLPLDDAVRALRGRTSNAARGRQPSSQEHP